MTGPHELDASHLDEERFTQGAVAPVGAEIDAHEVEPVKLRDERMRRFLDSHVFVGSDGQPVDPSKAELEPVDDPENDDFDWEG